MDKSFTINVNGKMYIGDLCYALSDEVYKGIWGTNNYEDGAYEAPDGMFAMVGTAYGDGSYESNVGFEFPVDAGIIGICDGRLVAKDITDLGILVDANGEANISYNDGTIAITYTTPSGETEFIDIETAYDDEEDNEDYEDDYSNDYDDEDLDEALNLAKPYTYVDVDYNPVTDMGSVWYEVPVINKENNNRLQIIFDYEKGNNTPKLRLVDGNVDISLEDVPSKFDAKKDQLKDLVKLLEKNANSRIYFIRNLHEASSNKVDNVEVNSTELAYEAKENNSVIDNKKFKSENYTDSLINEYLDDTLDTNID